WSRCPWAPPPGPWRGWRSAHPEGATDRSGYPGSAAVSTTDNPGCPGSPPPLEREHDLGGFPGVEHPVSLGRLLQLHAVGDDAVWLQLARGDQVEQGSHVGLDVAPARPEGEVLDP